MRPSASIRAGLDAARRNGKLIGRRAALRAHQRDHVLDLIYNQGKSKEETARIMGVGKTTIYRVPNAAAPATNAEQITRDGDDFADLLLAFPDGPEIPPDLSPQRADLD